MNEAGGGFDSPRSCGVHAPFLLHPCTTRRYSKLVEGVLLLASLLKLARSVLLAPGEGGAGGGRRQVDASCLSVRTLSRSSLYLPVCSSIHASAAVLAKTCVISTVIDSGKSASARGGAII